MVCGATALPQIILRPTEPWESFGVLVYNTIVQMGPSDYRMYYDTGWSSSKPHKHEIWVASSSSLRFDRAAGS